MRHRLWACAGECHAHLGRIEARDLAGSRDQLDPVQECVGSVIAGHHGWMGFANFAGYGGVKREQPDFATAGVGRRVRGGLTYHRLTSMSYDHLNT